MASVEAVVQSWQWLAAADPNKTPELAVPVQTGLKPAGRNPPTSVWEIEDGNTQAGLAQFTKSL